MPLLVLGDPAYPLLSWLIKPFIGRNLSAEQESFNCYHSSVRIAVENSFGRLKARWRIIGKKIDTKIEFAKPIICTCCILHNICELKNNPITWERGFSHLAFSQPLSRPDISANSAGEQCRNAILNYVTKNLSLRTSNK